jgi:hypothetical protein
MFRESLVSFCWQEVVALTPLKQSDLKLDILVVQTARVGTDVG